MTTQQTHQESQAVSLVFGLAAILGLLFISTVAVAGPAWLGLLIGAVELVVAWRVAPPAGARSLRIIAASIGGVTLVWSLLRFFVS